MHVFGNMQIDRQSEVLSRTGQYRPGSRPFVFANRHPNGVVSVKVAPAIDSPVAVR